MFRNHEDFEREAAARLPKGALGYFAGGSLDEATLTENRTALSRIKLRWKALAGVTSPKTGCTLLGQELGFPLIVAPIAFQRMAHPEGEIGMARAVKGSGSLMVLSTTSTASIAEVSEAAHGALWFQLYMMKDREVTRDLIRTAEGAGARAIALTVDVPAWGLRERDTRNQFALPEGLRVESLVLPGHELFYDGSSRSDLASFLASRLKFDLTWDDFAWLKSITKLPVVLKGIGRADDARMAVESGASAVWVSNHGGRQLDSAVGIADVLPQIAEQVAGKIPIIADGAVRRGTDVLKLLARGATAAAIGRAVLWGLAVDGEAGAFTVLSRIRTELENAMSLTGCEDLSRLADATFR
jgi:4-hydroxymandelate oxidase